MKNVHTNNKIYKKLVKEKELKQTWFKIHLKYMYLDNNKDSNNNFTCINNESEDCTEIYKFIKLCFWICCFFSDRKNIGECVLRIIYFVYVRFDKKVSRSLSGFLWANIPLFFLSQPHRGYTEKSISNEREKIFDKRWR